MEEAIVEFGQSEEARLTAQMEQKEITVCQDETFHPEVCLVAIEPASNYILLEKYTENRKAETWNQEMKEALDSLPVKVIQSTSDQGRAICSHVKENLKAHHSPDLFHGQQELVKATAPALRRQLNNATKEEKAAGKQLAKAYRKENSSDTKSKATEMIRQKLRQNGTGRDVSSEMGKMANQGPDRPTHEIANQVEIIEQELHQLVCNIEGTQTEEHPQETQLETQLETDAKDPADLLDQNRSTLWPVGSLPSTKQSRTQQAKETANSADCSDQLASKVAALAQAEPPLPSAIEDAEVKGQPHATAASEQESNTLLQASQEFADAQKARLLVEKRLEESALSIKRINQLYHPIDLQDGNPVDPAVVGRSLTEEVEKIEKIAHEADLSPSSIKRIAKFKRLISQMVATLTFFFLTITAKVRGLGLTEQVQEVVLSQLIPAIYVDLCSKRSSDPEERKRLSQLSQHLLDQVNARDGPFAELSSQELNKIEKVAIECAQLFQRSSSCVEGRNGQLALRHHSWHRLSKRKLSALTTVHNYFIKRPDGTTPAERFFAHKPKELFPWLLERLTLLARPAQKRPRPAPAPYLAKYVGGRKMWQRFPNN